MDWDRRGGVCNDEHAVRNCAVLPAVQCACGKVIAPRRLRRPRRTAQTSLRQREQGIRTAACGSLLFEIVLFRIGNRQGRALAGREGRVRRDHHRLPNRNVLIAAATVNADRQRDRLGRQRDRLGRRCDCLNRRAVCGFDRCADYSRWRGDGRRNRSRRGQGHRRWGDSRWRGLRDGGPMNNQIMRQQVWYEQHGRRGEEAPGQERPERKPFIAFCLHVCLHHGFGVPKLLAAWAGSFFIQAFGVTLGANYRHISFFPAGFDS